MRTIPVVARSHWLPFLLLAAVALAWAAATVTPDPPLGSRPVPATTDGGATLGVSGLTFVDRTTLAWSSAPGANAYALYRGRIPESGFSGYDHICEATELTSPLAVDRDLPPRGEAYYYLVTGLTVAPGSIAAGPLGGATGATRPESATISCGPRLYVDPDVVGGGENGLSWADAYTSVSSAFNDARALDRGSEVWIRGEPVGTARLQVRDGVRLLGGFAGTEVVPWARAPTATPTRLSVPPGVALPLLRVIDASVVLDGLVLADAAAGLVIETNAPRVEVIDTTTEEISGRAIDVICATAGACRLNVERSTLTGGTGALRAIVTTGTLEGRLRRNNFGGNATDSILRLEARPDLGDADLRVDVVANTFAGGARGVTLGAHTTDGARTARQTSFLGSNLILAALNEAVRIEASAVGGGAGPGASLARPVLVGNTIVDGMGDGVVVSAVRDGLQTVHAAPELWDNLITHHGGAGVVETLDDPGGGLLADPLLVRNDLFGNGTLYVDEGGASLTDVAAVNALAGARENYDQDPLYVDRPAGDYHLRFGTIFGASSPARWQANTADPAIGLDWTLPGFDDSLWSVGSYGIGYDSGLPPNAGDLIVTEVPPGAASIYTRLDFSIDDVRSIMRIVVGADYDDGWALWINGTEAFRSATLPPGPLDWNSPAAPHESSNGAVPVFEQQDVTVIALPLLQNGVNVFAIGAWNEAGASDDLVLVPSLLIDSEPPSIDRARFDPPRVAREDLDGGPRAVDGRGEGIAWPDGGADERSVFDGGAVAQCIDADGDGYGRFGNDNCPQGQVADCDDLVAACNVDCTDADGDGLSVCSGDCDDANSACGADCTDVDGDGVCPPFDCRDDLASCTTTCVDADEDGLPACAGDCDDTNAGCTTDCTDGDGDGFCVTTDCNDANSNCGIDCTDTDGDGVCAASDCDDTEPLCAFDCTDEDGDGRCAEGDCDDANPNCAADCTDADIDGVCADLDCDEGNPACAFDCADADADGLCVDADCDPDNANCGADCTDTDADGWCADIDCDDTNANCRTDCTDADADGWCADVDCDDTNANCRTDCTDADADGYCIDVDCDDTRGACFVDCTDQDGDGSCADADCAPANPNCTLDCTDLDADGFCGAADCDDANPNCNSDCNDLDADGYCSGVDCDDGDPACRVDCSDGDGDGVCADADCAPDNPNCTSDCTDFDGDGFCVDTDCNENRFFCRSDCTDQDGDHVCAEFDCDDTAPFCRVNCTDTDQDGFCFDLDCDDTVATCTSDCSAPNCQGCTDQDGDGVCINEDCNDFNANCSIDCADADGDGLCADLDCDDTREFCRIGCTNADGDDRCAPFDCNDTLPLCGADCTDRDGDLACVDRDCDESNPFCNVDCGDLDNDGICAPYDCDDGNASCTTDCSDADGDGACATADCDAANPNCSSDCTDADGDGFCVTHDCDDALSAVNPDATEICGDGRDNDCDGFADAADAVCPGLEVAATLVFSPGSTERIEWSPAAVADAHAIYRGGFGPGAFDGYDHLCEATELGTTQAIDPDVPRPGHGFYYLASGLAVEPGPEGTIVGGSLGVAATGQRPESRWLSCGPRVFVDPDVAGSTGSGLSWAEAYTSLAVALNDHRRSRDRGIELWARGTDASHAFLAGRAGARVLGGFEGNESSAWERSSLDHPTLWRGEAGSPLPLLRSIGRTVVVEDITLSDAANGLVVNGEPPLVLLDRASIREMAGRAIDLTCSSGSTCRLDVQHSRLTANGLGAIRAVVTRGRLEGVIRRNEVFGGSDAALRLEARPLFGDATVALDIVANRIAESQVGLLLGADVDDRPHDATQVSFVGSNVVFGTVGDAVQVVASGRFQSVTTRSVALAAPLLVANTLADGGGRGVFVNASRIDTSGALAPHDVRATPELWDNLITGHPGGAVAESTDTVSGVVSDPAALVRNDLFGSTPLYRNEGSTSLSTIGAVNALDGAAGNYAQAPLYLDPGAGDYHLRFGTLFGAASATRWLANASDPGLGVAWTQPGFDDSTWVSGPFGVGYDTGPSPNASGLLKTPVPAGASSVYTRLELQIGNVRNVMGVVAGADYDDGWALWINGTEVFRSPELPAGTLAWDTPAAPHESSNAATPVFGLQDVTAAALPALQNGVNVFAIGVWNDSPGSDDLVLVPLLRVDSDPPSIDRGRFDAPRLPLEDIDGTRRTLDGNGDGIGWPDGGADERAFGARAGACLDGDGDGFGRFGAAECAQPGIIDCNDAIASCTTDCSDTDGDGLALCAGDCDDANPNCTTDCADPDGDGFCLPFDCDPGLPACTTDCSDDDGDGLAVCEGDCDDARANCTVDCTDADEDDYCSGIDCDDANPNCRADCTDGDADGYCNGVDCNDAVTGCVVNCSDADADGVCADLDCDLANPNCGIDCSDADGDGFCIDTDCDDANSNCNADCTDEDADGYCNGIDCDDTATGCVVDCSDADADGVCTDLDCDPANTNCGVDCTDADTDGYCIDTDCDDGDPACSIDCGDADGDGTCNDADCDPANPNCSTDCTDADGDGLCTDADCDPANPNCSTDCTDADGDAFCVTSDCDEANPNCRLDCTDTDGDGYCSGVDCASTDPACFADCTDPDGDGLCTDADCDPANPNCSTDCTDADGDAFCVTSDCDEANPNCRLDCTDTDGDGYCSGVDCNDGAAACTTDCALCGPPNDLCQNAQQIDVGQTLSGFTTTATPDDGTAFDCGTAQVAAPGVWYSVNGNGTTLTASTCNAADFDTQVSVFCGPGCGEQSCVDGNDDRFGCAGFTSEVTFCSLQGVSYRLFVQGFGGETGNFDLTVESDGLPCSNAVSCLPP